MIEEKTYQEIKSILNKKDDYWSLEELKISRLFPDLVLNRIKKFENEKTYKY